MRPDARLERLRDSIHRRTPPWLDAWEREKVFLIREASKGSEKDFERKSKSHSADDDDAAAHGAR